MNLTEKQKEIVGYDLKMNEMLKIIAFAGTGKTTTLVEFAKARPGARFLYVAFNKSVQLEAASKFPNNVVCKTAHSLAWPEHGRKYQGRIIQGLKANTVREALGLGNYEEAKFTIDALINYLVSDDAKVSSKHIPSSARLRYQKSKRSMPDFVELTNRLGRMMCDGTNEDMYRGIGGRPCIYAFLSLCKDSLRWAMISSPLCTAPMRLYKSARRKCARNSSFCRRLERSSSFQLPGQ